MDRFSFDLVHRFHFGPGHPNFCEKNDCLVQIHGPKLVPYQDNRSTFCVGPDVSVLTNSSFASSTRLRTPSFNAQARLQRFPAYGFSDCQHLRSVKVPKRVRIIGGHCFHSCFELTEATFDFPSTIRKIESSAITGCHLLASFIVPSSGSILGNSVFLHCT
jgi:hypothetical protein